MAGEMTVDGEVLRHAWHATGQEVLSVGLGVADMLAERRPGPRVRRAGVRRVVGPAICPHDPDEAFALAVGVKVVTVLRCLNAYGPARPA